MSYGFNNKTIEDILLEKNLLTIDQVSSLRFENQNTGVPIAQIIKDRGLVSSLEFAKSYSEAYNIPYVSLPEKKPDPSLMSYVTMELAKSQEVVPFEFNPETNELSLAMVDPLDLPTIEFVEKRSNVKVLPFITTPEDVKKVLSDFQGS
ncbi:hypothetical protein KBG31_03530, partial [Patescibacteria group bacterium]|nr:hypothetical protein [Patescibacteria group bacterium]